MVTSGNFASQIIPSALTPAAQHQRLIPKAGGAATRTSHAELGRGLDQGAGLFGFQAELQLKARSTRR